MARFTSERGQNVQVCLNVNPARPGAAYGYVDMGGWIGGQSEYVLVTVHAANIDRPPI